MSVRVGLEICVPKNLNIKKYHYFFRVKLFVVKIIVPWSGLEYLLDQKSIKQGHAFI